MLALLKRDFGRNFWETFLAFVGAALIFSIVDWAMGFGDGVRMWGLRGAVIVGMAVGMAAFLVDLYERRYRFLAYLPLRRHHVWLSHYFSGFVIVVCMVAALTWHRIEFLAMGDEEVTAFFANPRWGYTLGYGALVYFSFSLGVFFASAPRNLFVGWVPAVLVIMSLVPAYMTIYTITGLQPSVSDIAPILILSGALLSVAGLIIYSAAPWHVSSLRMSFFGAIPAFVLVLAITAGHLYLSCLRWKEPQFDRVQVGQEFQLKRGNPDYLIVEARLRRSIRLHSFSIDLDSGELRHLGRALEHIDDPNHKRGLLGGPVDKIAFLSRRTPDSLFMDDHYLIQMDPGVGNAERILLTTPKDRDDAVSYSSFIWPPGSRRFLGLEDLPNTSRSNLIAFDPDGDISYRVPIFGPLYGSLWCYVSETGYALTLAAAEEPRAESDVYLRIAIETGEIERFKLPGEVIAFSPDITRVACRRQRIEGGRRYKSVVLVEIPSLTERVLIPEGDLPSVELEEQVVDLHSPLIFVDSFISQMQYARPASRNPNLYFNPAFDKAVWVRKGVAGDNFIYTFILFDLATGSRTILLGPDRLPKIPVLADDSRLAFVPIIQGFVSDGGGFVYTTDEGIYILSVPEGERNSLALLPRTEIPWTVVDERGTTHHVDYQYSHDGRRVLRLRLGVVGSAPTTDGAPVAPENAWPLEVFEGGRPRVIYISPERITSAMFLDPDRIAFATFTAVYLIAADGSNLRRVFPPEQTE